MTDLPAVPPRRLLDATAGQMTVELAQVRAALDLLTPDQLPEAVAGAEHLRLLARAAERAKLADGAELDWAEAARLAERRLGQLLAEGREQGTVAVQGPGRPSAETPTNGDRFPTTLEKLGVGWRLAEDAAAMAALTEDQWADLVARGREGGNLARRTIAGEARNLVDRLADATERRRLAAEEAENRRAEAERLVEAITAEAERMVERAAELPPIAELPPLPEPDPEPEPVLNPADVPWQDRSTVAQLRAHEDTLRLYADLARRLEGLATAALPDHADTDAMLVTGVRSALGQVVASARTLAERYAAHLTDSRTLRSVE